PRRAASRAGSSPHATSGAAGEASRVRARLDKRPGLRPGRGRGRTALADEPGEVPEELPGDVRVSLDEPAEVPRRHHQAAQAVVGGDRGRPDSLADQRQLAEVVAPSELRHPAAVDGDGRLAVRDHEEVDAAHLALAHDRGPGAELALPEVAGEPPQLAL